MGLNSTQFISYRSIKVKNIDLIDDAWGISSEFCDVINLLSQLEVVPGRRLTKSLIQRIRKKV